MSYELFRRLPVRYWPPEARKLYNEMKDQYKNDPEFRKSCKEAYIKEYGAVTCKAVAV